MTPKILLSKWSDAQTHQRQYLLLENAIKRKYRNLELIRFIDDLLKASNGQGQKERFIKWSKRIILGTKRAPDPLHFDAFPDEYNREFDAISQEQKAYDPVKWLDNELELLQSEAHNEIQDSNVNFEQFEAKQDIYNTSQELLSAKDVMQLLGISKTTLDRRRVDGLPYRKDGRKVYFKKAEVIRFLESKRI